MLTERHPLQPFLPEGTHLIMLGSFPPARHRWSMNFFYPNFINDMWRIFGLCFFEDKNYFVDEANKTFRQQAIEKLLNEKGIGIYDTAIEVVRLKNTASDKDLQVVAPTDIGSLLNMAPHCHAVVTTGEKASQLLCSYFNVAVPKVGTFVEAPFHDRTLRLYRMPSSSRAYPMKTERKAEFYNIVFKYLRL